MREPLLSVIMPVYNSESYVETAVNSILAQTYKNIEVICVNDCSKDNSLNILNAIAQRDGRVRVIDSPVNVGAGEARNLGIENAKGEYITFVDADDTIENDLYECAVDMVVENNLDWIHWGMKEEYFDGNGKKLFEKNVFLSDELFPDAESMRKAVIRLEDVNIFGYQCNSFYRTDIVRKNGIRFESSILYEDFFFNLDFARFAENLGVLSKTGYHYKKQNSDSITTRYVPEYFELCRRRLSSLADTYNEWDLFDDTVKSVLGNIYLRFVLSALMRNCDEKCTMTAADRRVWVKKLYSDELFTALCKDMTPQGKVNKILSFLLSRKQTTLLCMLGRFIYTVKVKYPDVFLKLKTNP